MNDVLATVLPVLGYVLGLSLYALFTFKFYRVVASRDIFGLPLPKSLLSIVVYVTKYLGIFPIFAYLWVAVLAVMLSFLSHDKSLEAVLLVALVTVSTVRVTAYVDEDLARDLAKILPFAVLSVLLVGTLDVDVVASFDRLRGVSDLWQTVLYYWAFLVALELALRTILLLVNLVRRRDQNSD